ncbi:probable LRR receptor-like serine/threonine-protein kinase At3g47570 [Quercus suber]|uniref:probable LRR receptor-like serine/threonine-protein kinase At3g47570 n=1 Tax=Quercus suber TaxID=58331 RepID=UPI0032DEF02B
MTEFARLTEAQMTGAYERRVSVQTLLGVTCSPSSKQVIVLDLEAKRLVGFIPPSLGNLTHLTRINLRNNRFYGEIPQEVGHLQHLQHLDLSGNSFGGKLPPNLSYCTQLRVLNVTYNNLIGQIPHHLSSLSKLVYLSLGVNSLTGNIPAWIGNFSSLYGLGLSRNNFQGSIPSELGCLPSLGRFQLSQNYLSESTNGFSENNLIGSGSFGSVYKGVLSRNGAVVAVKVLNLQQQGALKSFINECNALRDIRHRNLLKIISVCSSVDHEGNDFKSLIFEFMCNGSLEQWLHPKSDEQHQRKNLSFLQRLNIAIDVAYALEYLHHHSQSPIVHCDLKPSNILLDEDMVAHVGDFGLVKYIFEASKNLSNTQTLSSGLKGSIGYIPPEYGMGGQVSTLGDIYSYGILLLEMLIGKRPTDEVFKDGQNIHTFIAMALPEHVINIIDPLMFFEEDEEEVDDTRNEEDVEGRAIIEEENLHVNVSSRMIDCLMSVFQIGLSCSASSPNERIPINVVVNEMNAIRDIVHKLKKGRRRARMTG